MAYTIISMRAALRNVLIANGAFVQPEVPSRPGAGSAPLVGTKSNPFAWEEPAYAGTVDPRLAAKFKFKPHANLLNDLTEYCWLVYSKALRSGNVQIIGRTTDLWVAAQFERAGLREADGAKNTLWQEGATGTIQKMDKWSPNVNDCWVLGAIHRLASFELVSKLVMRNLWDFGKAYHVVTAREVLGLQHFGYRLHETDGKAMLLCDDSAKAKDATIEEYHHLMVDLEQQGPASVLKLLKPAHG